MTNVAYLSDMKPSELLDIKVRLMEIARHYAPNSYNDFTKKYNDLIELLGLGDFIPANR